MAAGQGGFLPRFRQAVPWKNSRHEAVKGIGVSRFPCKIFAAPTMIGVAGLEQRMDGVTIPGMNHSVLLAEFLAAMICHCEAEIASMNGSVRLLEKVERERIMDTYQEGQRWRGLASDNFTRMVDALVVLTDGQIAFSDAMPP